MEVKVVECETNPGSRAGPGASEFLANTIDFKSISISVNQCSFLVQKFTNTLDSLVVPIEVIRTIKSKLVF